MSTAIFAYINWDGAPLHSAILRRANRAVQHRCPHGAWVWRQDSVGLAQASLATLPEDEPHHPIENGRSVIAASCRLDNRTELLQKLPAGSVSSHSSDAAFMLAAYQRWGLDFTRHLLGDFAVIIWDKARRRLVACRDLSGSRSLYYFADGRRLVMASEHTQIFQDPSVPRRVDDDQVTTLLTPAYQWTMGWNLGMFADVHALLAGHTLIAQKRQRNGAPYFEITCHPFWSWDTQTLATGSRDDLHAEYLALLEQAVNCRLRSTQPVALELSGGLDSSALVCLAGRRLAAQTPPLHTASLVFDRVPETDESERIAAVLDALPPGRMQTHCVDGSSRFAPAFLFDGWSPRSLLEPPRLLTTAAQDQLYAHVNQAGCCVILSGEMGDTLNDGSPLVHYDLLRRRKWGEAMRRLRWEWRRSRRQTVQDFVNHGIAPFLPWPLLRPLATWLAMQEGRADLPAYFRPNFAKRVRQVDTDIQRRRAQQWPIQSPAVRALLSDFLPPMPLLGSPQPEALEFRYPYTDRRLLEFILRLPPEMKWQHEQENYLAASRWHHRQALRGILPDAVRCQNLGVYFDPAAARSMPPRLLTHWVAQEPLLHIAERGYVDKPKFMAALKQGEDASGYISTMLCMEAWLRGLEPGGKLATLLN